MRGTRITTQVGCLEATARIALSISVNPMTSAAASDPPTTPPSADVAMMEGNAERTANVRGSFMEFLQVPLRAGYKGVYVSLGRLEDN
jgi:hypothetical protein